MICAESDEGIGRRAAVHAGVEVGVRAAGFDLGVDHAAQTDAEGGQIGREHFGVGDEGDIGFESVAVLADKGGDPLPANFLFAFDDDADVERQFAVVGGEAATSSALTCIHSWPLSSTAPRA